MRTLALTAAALAAVAAFAPAAGAAPALQYDVALGTSAAEIHARPHEQFNFQLTATNLGTEDPGNSGGLYSLKVKGLKFTAAQGEGWSCTVEPDNPDNPYAFFCLPTAKTMPTGTSHAPVTVFATPDGTGSNVFIPANVDGWRRSEQNHGNNRVNILVWIG
ncbi:hypothetical protein JOF53_005128 [Crossiella equi]|uniref:DUF11 domain-containing protein n=1 Tax=Crossiella equi TaxID=130796 RepID=A0ABS5AIQ7_9PSEU|nr:hypothetical protein [Crossiella equi]MBP2476256.1 hypothetical protein [Crossiella equi]